MRSFGDMARFLWLLFLLIFSAGATAEIAATTDRYQVALGDSFRLIITATEGEDLDDIQLSSLHQNFEVLGRSSSSQTHIVNGRRSHSRQLDIDLAPIREGTLTIPALTVGKKKTRPISVTVTPEPVSSGGNQAVIFEAEVDRSSVYVQGQVILTLRVIQAINLDSRSISEMELEGAFVKPLEQNTFQRNINGRPSLVNEVRYAIFPEQSGTLTIPAQVFVGREATSRRSVFDLGGNGRRLRRATKPITIEVLPSPRQFPSNTWLPARNLAIEETWSTSPDQLEVGSSATRTITIKGEGLQGAQLPPVLFKPIDGLKFYPDQAVIEEEEVASGLLGVRQDSAALVPVQHGEITLPEIRIPWWDTESKTVRYAVLPARNIEITASGAGAAAPVLQPIDPIQTAAPAISSAEHSSALRWKILSGISSLGWLLTIIYLLTRKDNNARPTGLRSTGDRNSSERKLFKELLGACKENNSLHVSELLGKWASSIGDGRNIHSPGEAARALDDDQLGSLVDELEKSLYAAGEHAWQGDALAEHLKTIRPKLSKKPAPAEELRLYPESA
jgi:BatD DUF11 like domain